MVVINNTEKGVIEKKAVKLCHTVSDMALECVFLCCVRKNQE
jgi:hypothetical protein